MNIAIFGSCVSADALFNRSDVKVAWYLARSSLSSQVLPGFEWTALLDAIESDFQRRVVRDDMIKSLWPQLQAGGFDLLLVDFIDDRFSLHLHPDGGAHTMSSEYMVAHKKIGASLSSEVLTNNDLRKFALWQQGWDRMVQTLTETGDLSRLVVNKVYYATHDAAGKPMKGAPFERENAALQARYDHIARTLPDVATINYAPELFVGDPNHKWGVSPFHYMPAIYQHTRDALFAITERHDL